MTDNLKIWNAVSTPETTALKPFKRSGGFMGTAIKPMWSIRAMTEQFGPCGEGWGINEPRFDVHPVGNEILVYCTVSIWHTKRENIVFGVGGDKVLKHIAENIQYNKPERWESDDEAFKKAFTDAITNAFKHLGVGAAIHMGLWDGSKYIAEKDDDTKPIVALSSAHTPTKSGTRDDKDLLCKEIGDFASLAALKAWASNPAVISRMNDLHPDHLDVVRNSYAERQHELKKGLAS